ncbi:thiol reductase thioredoxin [Noviherbaspirillum aridicola]|uniref:Thiol reductase thioredoxin n=2 Tax=Noviherbaspirillum aridicola TaxID=2849687 RepID=A0ABQ4Q2J5_9BURK|nr:thiol reductase thioredoxin [Noviherbaspirillum aridicola]
MTRDFAAIEPARTEIDSLPGATVLEFGTPWCGFCLAAQPLIADAFDTHPAVRHIKVEDGKGRPLGRSFRVTLWPTLVFLRDGRELSRLVRPTDAGAIREALAAIDAG